MRFVPARGFLSTRRRFWLRPGTVLRAVRLLPIQVRIQIRGAATIRHRRASGPIEAIFKRYIQADAMRTRAAF